MNRKTFYIQNYKNRLILPVELRNNFAYSLGSSSGSGDDVLRSSTAVPPCLGAGAINGLLGSCVGVDCGHQTLHNAELVVDDLGKGSQAVGCAGGIAVFMR